MLAKCVFKRSPILAHEKSGTVPAPPPAMSLLSEDLLTLSSLRVSCPSALTSPVPSTLLPGYRRAPQKHGGWKAQIPPLASALEKWVVYTTDVPSASRVEMSTLLESTVDITHTLSPLGLAVCHRVSGTVSSDELMPPLPLSWMTTFSACFVKPQV